MLKVFLVEDEIVIREGIKNNIPWKEEGFDFVGEASDGELAFPLIQKLTPDILITDIRMPFTDGLELSRLVKKEFPNIKIIILSGYNEFNYAKEAINIGVAEYLLKPISSEKLLQAIKSIAVKIEEEKKFLEYVNRFKYEMQENRNIEKQKFFNELIFKELSLSEILEKANKLEMNLSATIYNIIIFKVMVSGETTTCYSNDINTITDQVKTMIEEQDHIYMFDRGAEGWAFLLKGENEEQFEQIINNIFGQIVNMVQQRYSLEFFCGIGKAVKRLSEIPQSYDKANHAFSYRYLGKTNQLISYKQIEERMNLDENLTELSSITIGKVDRRLLENFLKTGTIAEVNNFVINYFHGLGKENTKSIMFRQYILMDMYFCVASFIESIGLNEEEILNRYGGMQQVTDSISSLEKSMILIEKIIIQAIEIRDNASMKKYERLLQQAKDYINEFYSRDDISLNTVAASVNISPSYFSTIFSQELGVTFIEYLTDVRMQKAKELLMCTTKKTAEVGFAVGYKDPHYFSYLFKKTQNCTPKEFRMRGKEK